MTLSHPHKTARPIRSQIQQRPHYSVTLSNSKNFSPDCCPQGGNATYWEATEKAAAVAMPAKFSVTWKTVENMIINWRKQVKSKTVHSKPLTSGLHLGGGTQVARTCSNKHGHFYTDAQFLFYFVLFSPIRLKIEGRRYFKHYNNNSKSSQSKILR